MTRSRWIIFIALCVITIGGLMLFSKKDSINVDNVDPAKAVSETTTEIGDRVYGNKAAKVTLIEYGDFQCPACGGAYPQVKTIKETYKDQVAFIFRNFPLTAIHPNALAASTAAEAAGIQGKFWEMHDKLYENVNAWSTVDASKRTDTFAGYAQDIGLDIEQFKNDLSDPKVTAKISRDRAFGNKIGVTGTPSFFIGSTKVSDEVTSDIIQAKGEKLMDQLDAALKAAGVKPPVRS